MKAGWRGWGMFIAGALLLQACASERPPRLSREELLDPEACKTCHVDQFREWSGSMHAYAAEDPVFVAMNQRGQRETGGALGSFCVNCHAPMAVKEGATQDGLNLDQVPKKLKGVTCYFCHSVDGVDGTHNNPLTLASDRAMRGPFSDPVESRAHDSVYSGLHNRDTLESASMCGACHDIVTGHGAAIERTFTEWQASVFSKAPGGTTCGQCHMPQSPTLRPIAEAPGVFARRTHSHAVPGVDVALTPFPEMESQRKQIQDALDDTLQTALCVGPSFNPKVHVIIDNVGAGHSWPSGATQDRRAWTEVVAYEGAGVLYQSGVVPEGTAATTVWKSDPDMWLIRDCIFDPAGEEAHMFWEAASFEGNALPAKATFNQLDPRFYQTHVVRSFPRGSAGLGKMPDRVTLQVKLRPMGLEVIDDLIATGDLDPAVRANIPTFTIGKTATLEWTPETATETYLDDNNFPIRCVTRTNLNVAADRYPAFEPTRCKSPAAAAAQPLSP